MKVTDLDHICSFQSRAVADDGHGNKLGEFQEVFREWAGFRFLRGGEGIVESRLASEQPAILTVRSTLQTQAIAPDWQVVCGGRSYRIKEPPRPSGDRLYLEFLVVLSPATG